MQQKIKQGLSRALKRVLVLRGKLDRSTATRAVPAVVLAAVVMAVARRSGWWAVAVAVVLAAEWWPLVVGQAEVRGRRSPQRRELVLSRMLPVVMGVSVAAIIALVPRLASQVLVALVYAAWRWWWAVGAAKNATTGELLPAGLARLLVEQAVLFEAVFLAAATLRPPAWVTLILVWAGAYASVYAVLTGWGERAAAALAATWALVAAEVSWVLQLWLFTYATAGGYVLVPQPALILTALAYCFGSIYWSQRQGNLSRGRLTEYLLIGLILIVLVAVGTSWRGSI